MTFSFTIESTAGAARAGVFVTPHGPVETPAFMAVGTLATVKALDPDDLVQMGASMILGNAYHLHLRPGDEVVLEMGGLHRFMHWDRPILTDSGGFQVFCWRSSHARESAQGSALSETDSRALNSDSGSLLALKSK